MHGDIIFCIYVVISTFNAPANFGLLCVQCSEVEHSAIGYSKTQYMYSKLAVISLGSMYFCLLSPSLCFLCLLFLCECVCMIVYLSKLVLLILLSSGKKIDLPVVCQYLQCMLSLSCSFILIHMYSPVSHSYRIV